MLCSQLLSFWKMRVTVAYLQNICWVQKTLPYHHRTRFVVNCSHHVLQDAYPISSLKHLMYCVILKKTNSWFIGPLYILQIKFFPRMWFLAHYRHGNLFVTPNNFFLGTGQQMFIIWYSFWRVFSEGDWMMFYLLTAAISIQ